MVVLTARRQPKPGAVLAVAGFGAFLAFLDSTIVNVAFPSIQHSFPTTSLSTLSWVLNAYNVVFAGLLVAAGRFADLIGRRRMFVLGTAVFVLSSAGCAAATSVEMLIAFRVLQGIGCAILVPASLAMVVEAFPDEKLTEGVTLWGATAALAAGLGPPIGGALVNSGNWRYAFVINIPLGLLAVVVAKRAVVESRAPGRRRLPDLLGTALLIAGFTGLTLAIVKGVDWGWASGRVLVTAAAAVAVLVVFGRRNARHPAPVLDPQLLRTRRFAVANLVTVVAGAGFYAYGLTHILWLRYVWHYSLLDAGLAVAPGALVAAVAAAALGRLAERHGHRVVVVFGAGVWALALTWYATKVGVRPDFFGTWLPGQIISGMGVGATLPVVTGAGLVGIPGGRYAAASAAVSSTRQFGAVLGIASLVAIIGTPTVASAATAFRQGWVFSACCFVAAGIFALFLGNTRTAHTSPPAPEQHPAADEPAMATVSTEPIIAGPTRAWTHALFDPVLDPAGSGLRSELRSVEIVAGEFLFRQGDTSDGMYVVRVGQLEVIIDDVVVSRLGVGSAIGELALLTGAPRSASIRARRDSRLDQLTPAAFDQLTSSNPTIALGLARSVATRLQELNPPEAPPPRPRVVAVVGCDPAAPVRAVSAALVRGLSAYVRAVDPGVVDSSGLDRAESSHERVVLTAASDEPEWRDFCLRSADRTVLVAGDTRVPDASPAALSGDCHLVLSAADIGRADLVAWSSLIAPVSVHRVRGVDDLDGQLRPLIARLAQRAIGLVLAGGGARSLAHLGVLDELERAGVLIDRVAGTSAGAVVGALLATGRTAAEVDAVLYEEFVRRNPVGDYTVPRLGIIRGERTVAALRRHLGEMVIEELPHEFHCVSVDLVRRSPVIHSRGSLADAVTASLRIPGLFPPILLNGVVHVDGAVLDNLPVGAMEKTPDGPIIAVNIGTGGGSGSPVPAQSRRPPRIPGLAETLMRTMFMSSAPATAAALARADLVITPQTSDVGFLEWHQIDVLRDAGRRAAIEAMPAILELAAQEARA